MNNSIGGVKNRRKGALERLIAQLKTGKKTVMVYESAMTKHSPRFIPGKFVLHKVDLTEADISRINREIEALKSRI